MRINVSTSQAEAIRMGKNSTEWIAEIDVAALTQAQRERLAKTNDRSVISLCDSAGNITADSIQSVIDAEEKEKQQINDEVEKHVATLKVEDFIFSGGRDLKNPYRRPEEKNHTRYIELKTAAEKIIADNIARGEAAREAVKKATADWDAKYLPLIVAYESGGDRPAWSGTWAGSNEMLNRIGEEDMARYEKEKSAQLTEAVKSLGTDNQRERWAAGVMPIAEAIALIYDNAIAPIVSAVGAENVTKKNEIMLIDECQHNGAVRTKKRTLSAAEWDSWKKAKTTIPANANVNFFSELNECQECGEIRATVAEISWAIGVIDIIAEIRL